MAIPVEGGTVWLSDPGAPAGMAIPLDLAAADPRALSHLLPPADARLLPALGRGQVLLGRSSARLRGLAPAPACA